jgi:hypothetical protein
MTVYISFVIVLIICTKLVYFKVMTNGINLMWPIILLSINKTNINEK